ncbi:MAG: hypothetical protein WDW36_002513 [Sanguina aurantia]
MHTSEPLPTSVAWIVSSPSILPCAIRRVILVLELQRAATALKEEVAVLTGEKRALVIKLKQTEYRLEKMDSSRPAPTATKATPAAAAAAAVAAAASAVAAAAAAAPLPPRAVMSDAAVQCDPQTAPAVAPSSPAAVAAHHHDATSRGGGGGGSAGGPTMASHDGVAQPEVPRQTVGARRSRLSVSSDDSPVLAQQPVAPAVQHASDGVVQQQQPPQQQQQQQQQLVVAVREEGGFASSNSAPSADAKSVVIAHAALQRLSLTSGTYLAARRTPGGSAHAPTQGSSVDPDTLSSISRWLPQGPLSSNTHMAAVVEEELRSANAIHAMLEDFSSAHDRCVEELGHSRASNAELRSSVGELTHKLEMQTQRLELALQHSMALQSPMSAASFSMNPASTMTTPTRATPVLYNSTAGRLAAAATAAKAAHNTSNAAAGSTWLGFLFRPRGTKRVRNALI